MDCLIVDYCGSIQRIDKDMTLAFGRTAALVIDDNPFLHRTAGEFVYQGDMWWLANLGSSIALEIHDATTLSHAVLAPGTRGPLPFAINIVRFAAGGTTYELTARSELPPPGSDTPRFIPDATATFTHLPLTPSQRQLVAALAEPRLRNPTDRQHPLPTNRQVASRLGWEITKLNRKLDAVCAKLDGHGVKGLRGGIDSLATDRRRRLVEYAVTSGLVSLKDAEDLPKDTSAP